MNFQIRKIILWPKNKELPYKTIEFKLGEINIITGASRTGKSAIIPIIDYCLASGSCYIPVKTIRDACSWFGVVIQTDKSQLLLARRQPELQTITDDMYLLEAPEVEIPREIEKNITADVVRKYLDQISCLSLLDIQTDTQNQYFGRISFRDLMAFCFQPQNIVANANTLFYKADTTEHRNKLINIFPYVLGAATPDIILKNREKDFLEKHLKHKEKELLELNTLSKKWEQELRAWLASAKELGLIDDNSLNTNSCFQDQLDLLTSLANKTPYDVNILKRNIENSSDESILLKNEENAISLRLSSCQNRYRAMSELMENRLNFGKSLHIQIERLHIAKWLKLNYESGLPPKKCSIFNESPKKV